MNGSTSASVGNGISLFKIQAWIWPLCKVPRRLPSRFVFFQSSSEVSLYVPHNLIWTEIGLCFASFLILLLRLGLFWGVTLATCHISWRVFKMPRLYRWCRDFDVLWRIISKRLIRRAQPLLFLKFVLVFSNRTDPGNFERVFLRASYASVFIKLMLHLYSMDFNVW